MMRKSSNHRTAQPSGTHRKARSGVSLLPAGLAVLVLAAMSLAGCTAKTSTPAPKPFAVSKTYDRGPVMLELKLDKDHLNTAEKATLLLEARAAEGYQVEFPTLGEKAGGFTVDGYTDGGPTLGAGGTITLSRAYVLEPFLSGEYTIPSLKVAFWKSGEKDADHSQIDTGEVKVQVASVLPDGPAAQQLKGIAPPVPLPLAVRMGLLLALVLIVIALAGGGAFFYWRRRRIREMTAAPPIPPHELALRQLAVLLADRLIEQGQYKRYYIRVSDILRRYLENRFGLRAPESTTEEFLAQLGTNSLLRPPHRALLRDFLRHCDLVKFAKHQPSQEEIQQTYEVCRQFILDMEAAHAPLAVSVETAAAEGV